MELQQICLNAIAKKVKYFDIDQLPCPKSVINQIQNAWKDARMHPTDSIPRDFDYKSIFINNLSKTDVNALKQLKLHEVNKLSCFYEKNHVRLTHYYLGKPSGVQGRPIREKRLCDPCTLDKKILTSQPGRKFYLQSAYDWGRCRVVSRHNIIKYVIKQNNYWCDNCDKQLFFITEKYDCSCSFDEDVYY